MTLCEHMSSMNFKKPTKDRITRDLEKLSEENERLDHTQQNLILELTDLVRVKNNVEKLFSNIEHSKMCNESLHRHPSVDKLHSPHNKMGDNHTLQDDIGRQLSTDIDLGQTQSNHKCGNSNCRASPTPAVGGSFAECTQLELDGLLVKLKTPNFPQVSDQKQVPEEMINDTLNSSKLGHDVDVDMPDIGETRRGRKRQCIIEEGLHGSTPKKLCQFHVHYDLSNSQVPQTSSKKAHIFHPFSTSAQQSAIQQPPYNNSRKSDLFSLLDTQCIQTNHQPTSVELKSHGFRSNMQTFMMDKRFLQSIQPSLMTPDSIEMMQCKDVDLHRDKMDVNLKNEIGQYLCPKNTFNSQDIGSIQVTSVCGQGLAGPLATIDASKFAQLPGFNAFLSESEPVDNCLGSPLLSFKCIEACTNLALGDCID